MERLSAEGKFFHRSCFTCDYCGTTLRLSSYAFDVDKGMTLQIPECISFIHVGFIKGLVGDLEIWLTIKGNNKLLRS